MDTNYLKRTCELLLESSQDLVKEENATESFKKTRLYALQIIDLLEEKEESFIDILFKSSRDRVTSLSMLMCWINILVRSTWYTGDNYCSIEVSSVQTYNNTFVPVLTYLGFSSEIKNKDLILITPNVNAKVGSIAHMYINHQCGDWDIVQLRRRMYEAFFDRRVNAYNAFLVIENKQKKEMSKEEKSAYLLNLKDILLRDLGLVLNTETYECTAHETHGKMLIERLL